MKSARPMVVMAAAGSILLAAGLMAEKDVKTGSIKQPAKAKVIQAKPEAGHAGAQEPPKFSSPELEAKYQKLKAFQSKIHAQRQTMADLSELGVAYDEALTAATLQKQAIAEKIAKSNGAYALSDSEKAVVAAADALEQQAYSRYRAALAHVTHKGDSN